MKSPNDDTTGTVTLTVENPAAGNTAVIYSGTTATLSVTLKNQTGSDITFQPGSFLQMYMPGYFSSTQLGAMNIGSILPANWIFSYNSGDPSLELTASGNGTWANNSSLTFSINSVLGTGPANPADTVEVIFNNLDGNNIPLQLEAPLTLSDPIVPGNINLDTVLHVTTEFDGVLYVSTSVDPLTNTIYLNFGNAGATPLYSGNNAWSGNPQVIVTFVYGDTSGALAPDDIAGAANQGSAWNISGSVYIDETAGWSVQNPSPGQSGSPQWTLAPVQTNQEIIGTGANANVSFAFNTIFSFTPPGATQMYVHFKGFAQNENTLYNDEIFEVTINKLPYPSNTGILDFYNSPAMYIDTNGIVGTPGNGVLHLFWSGFAVASVGLQYEIAGQSSAPLSPFSKKYPDTSSLIHDSALVTIPDLVGGDQLNLTLYAYDTNENILNAFPFPVSVNQQPMAYAFSGPAGTINPSGNATFELNWQTFGVSSIEITSNSTIAFSYQATYADSNQWNPDSTTVALGVYLVQVSAEFTLNAYDANGNLLNSLACIANIAVNAWCDPKDQEVYSIAMVNNQVWMTQNYRYNDPSGTAVPYDFYWRNLPVYGRFYPVQTAIDDTPAGWRMPIDADWSALINMYQDNIPALLPGGSTGMNLVLGGEFQVMGEGFTSLGIAGLYWSIPAQPDSYSVFGFTEDIMELTVNPYNGVECFYTGCSVRYIMNDASADTNNEILLIEIE